MTTAVPFAPLRRLPPQRRLDAYLASKKAAPVWKPNPGEDGQPNPQELALQSPADEVFFGGAAGGGKTDLLLGAAFTRHKRSAVFRRVYPNLKGIINRSIEIQGSDDNYNRAEKEWRLPGQYIQFAAVQHEDDKKKWQGQPHDLKAFDEITEFTKTQYQFIIGWNRSSDPSQRSRVIATGNPPTDSDGAWIIVEWGPWLQPDHPQKAAPSELRWYYYDENDNIVWLTSGDPVEVGGETIYPRSRTFIPSKLSDNPHYNYDNSYRGRLQSMPEPLRSILLHGDFTATGKADPWQVIPTAWVKLAQRRWLEREKPHMPLSGVGVDVARGGRDALVIAKRYGTWYDELDSTPGVNVEDGPTAVGIMQRSLASDRNIGYINIDLIGVGTSCYDTAKVVWPGTAKAVNVASGTRYVARGNDGQQLFTMRNVRAEIHWRLREALDPETGDDIALPPGNDIVADLCAARYKVLAGGVIQIESKDDIKKRLGRSPDKGEAIMLAQSDFNEELQAGATTYA